MDQDATGSADPLSIRGVVPPTVTAFDESESVDDETTAAHARFVVDRGAHAVFPLGTNGEFAMLDDAERRSVIEAVVEEVGGEVPVIAGVGAPSTRRTVANARHAEEAGADGAVVVTPYYYPFDHVGAVEHYRRVAGATSLPVYVYHIPGRTGNALSLDAFGEIAAIEGVAGCKDSSKDVPWLVQAMDASPELSYLVGSDSLLLAGLEVGCAGLVSAVANAFPELVVELYDAYERGEEARARERQRTVFAIRDAFKSGGAYMSGVKAALRLRGFDAGPLRRPLRPLTADERDRLRSRLETHVDVSLDGS